MTLAAPQKQRGADERGAAASTVARGVPVPSLRVDGHRVGDSCRHPAPRCTVETPGRHTGFLPPPPPPVSQSVSQLTITARAQNLSGSERPCEGITAENLSTVRTANTSASVLNVPNTSCYETTCSTKYPRVCTTTLHWNPNLGSYKYCCMASISAATGLGSSVTSSFVQQNSQISRFLIK